MRVVFTVTFGERMGGAENMLMTFLRHADRSRIEPAVVFFEEGSWVSELDALGIKTVVLPTGRFREPHRGAAAIARFARVLRRRPPELVVNWFTRAQVYGAPAAVLAGLGARVVWWQHGVVGEDRWLDRLATLLPARAIGTSAAAAAEAQAQLRPHRPTFTVNPGVEPPVSRPASERARTRAELSVPDGAVLVGTVGRLQPWKGQHRLLDALAAARQTGQRLHGLVVGGDAHDLAPEYGAWLRRRARALGLEDHVSFTGHVPDPGRYIEAMDVFVNTATQEPFGIALVEAMARGRAVVAVDAPGPREIVEPGRSGLIADGAAALVLSIGRLAADPDLRQRLGDGAAQRYRSRYTPERMCLEIQARLEELSR